MLQSIVSALPTEWKIIMRQQRIGGISQPEEIVFVTNQKHIKLKTCRCRHFYCSLASDIRTPTAIARWEHYQIQPRCWRDIYELPYKCTRSTRLQSLHFRIVHRYIPTRKYLCTRGIVGSPLCLKCFELDDFQHFFFDCTDVKDIWNAILIKLKNKFNLSSAFGTFQSVIFGCPDAPLIVNLILLITKQYIVSCKLSYNDMTQNPNIQCLMGIITKYAQAERMIAQQQKKLEKYYAKWNSLLGERGQVAFE